MNGKKVIDYNSLISLLKLDSNPSHNKNSKFNNVTFDVIKATTKDIVFYNLNPGENNFLVLKERLKKSSYGVLCVSLQDLEFEHDVKNFRDTLVLKSSDFLKAQNHVLDALFPLDLKSDQKLVGVTGTNGKTSTCFFAHQLSLEAKLKSFCLGTLGIFDKNNKLSPLDSSLTTPTFIELRKIFYQYFVKENYDIGFMEVSSHALTLDRVYGIKFDMAGWTNFKQDHLDFHQTMEKYFEAKLLLPQTKLKDGGKFFISEGDEELKENLIGRGVSFESISPINRDESGLPHFAKLDFNRKNIFLALRFVREVKSGLQPNFSNLKAVPGRMEMYKLGEKIVFIDFAHTPDALENILKETRQNYDKKIAVVFGCGGDRDKKKRPLMAKAAEKYSDFIVVTSDNPRTEDPDLIIDDIFKGFELDKKILRIVDRKLAILEALKEIPEDGILLIAGKGAENYQIIGEKKIDYSDIDYVKELTFKDHI